MSAVLRTTRSLRGRPKQRARQIARKQLHVPKAVIREFDTMLRSKAARMKRVLMAHLTHPTETTMTTKRNTITKRAEPTPVPAAPTAPVKPVKKAGTRGTAEPKRTVTKAKPPERAAVTAKYTTSKLAVQAKCRIGTVVVYHGRVAKLDGERVKVVGHEGRGGVFIEFKDKRYVVSPLALLPKSTPTTTK